jgi:hypothetical protein
MSEAGNGYTAERVQVLFAFVIPKITAIPAGKFDGQGAIGIDEMI